jgi:hypothetical protein
MADRKNLNQVVISALKGCTTEVLIEDTFEKYSIKGPAVRIDYLNAAMGNPRTFFSAEPPVKVKYEVTIKMFLAGTWQLAALYEKAGLGL